MIKERKIEWRNFVEVPPIYVHKQSCHDPNVIKSIHRGIGLRLRINSSKKEYFKESVEEFSKAFVISGYSYEESKRKLSEFSHEEPVNLIRRQRRSK